MSEHREYKWQVKPGGTVPADSVSIKTATSQTGQTSIKKSLQIQKGEGSPTIDSSAMSVSHAMSVPDPTFNQRQFAKGEGKPNVSHDSVAITSAINAPRPPRTINSVDKTQQVRNNAHWD